MIAVKSRESFSVRWLGGQKNMEGFLLVCVFVLLVIIINNRSKQKNDRDDDRKLVRDLTTRVYLLEESVKKLKQEAATESLTEVASAVKNVTPQKPAEPVHPVKPVKPQPAPEVASATV